MKKLLTLAVIMTLVLLTEVNFVRAADDDPVSIVNTDTKMVIQVVNVFNERGVQLTGNEITTTTTTTTNSKNETATTVTVQTVSSEWRGGSVKVAKIEGTSNTNSSDESKSETKFTITYSYKEGTGQLSGASGSSNTTGDSGKDDKGAKIGTYKTSTVDSYTIRNGQALRTKSVTTGESFGSDGTKKGDIKQTSDTEYKLIAGTWQVSKETSVSENTSVDGGSEKITRTKTYTRDANGVCTGISQTASGTSIRRTTEGGTVTLGMTNYKAEFAFDSESGWYLKKESYKWEQGAASSSASTTSTDSSSANSSTTASSSSSSSSNSSSSGSGN